MSGIKLSEEGKVTRIKVLGAIDESTQLPEQLKSDVVIVDLEDLTLFNSMGVRIWLTWVRKKSGFNSLRLENCRSKFINQAHYVSEIIPDYAHVDSFYVPLFDPDNGESPEVKMVYGKDYDDNGFKMPEVKNAAGKLLQVDVTDDYFAFLKKK